jgi:quercetin dioxygenase-like cupin family protein
MRDGVSSTRVDFAGEERFVSLRRSLGVESLGINQVTLLPGQRGRIHRHRQQEEIYLVLAGTLTLLVEGAPRELDAGSIARLSPGVRRQLVNAGTERCVLVALGASGGYVGRDAEAFVHWGEAEGRPPQEVPLPGDLPDAGR